MVYLKYQFDHSRIDFFPPLPKKALIFPPMTRGFGVKASSFFFGETDAPKNTHPESKTFSKHLIKIKITIIKEILITGEGGVALHFYLFDKSKKYVN